MVVFAVADPLQEAASFEIASTAASSRPWHSVILRSSFACFLALPCGSVMPLAAHAQAASTDFGSVSAAASYAREQGDIPQALSLYQQAVHLNPAWPDGWWYLGTLQYGAGNYSPAVDAFSHYINLTPTAGPAMALRALSEFELGQYSQALDDLEHGIALGAINQPRNAGIIFYHEAILLTHFGRFEEALEKYAAMVKGGDVNDDITSGIGLAALRMPILPSQVDPSQQEIVSMVGHAAAAVMGGDLAGGKQAFAEIFARFPQSPNIHYSYGYLLTTIDPQQAIVELQKELDITPASAITHSMLAWTLGLEGEFASALPYAQKSAEEDPSLPMGQLVLGRDLIETGDTQAALPHLEAVLNKDPNNLEAHLTLAKAYSRMGRKEDAQRERMLCLKLSGRGTTADANL